jgi:multisubunit Na+/H+ antiporter MnhF subunit
MSVEAAYRMLYLVVLLAFCIMIGIMLIRSVLTRGVCEKIVCVNMLSTMVICAIAILSRMLDEAYLLDVALKEGLTFMPATRRGPDDAVIREDPLLRPATRRGPENA